MHLFKGENERTALLIFQGSFPQSLYKSISGYSRMLASSTMKNMKNATKTAFSERYS